MNSPASGAAAADGLQHDPRALRIMSAMAAVNPAFQHLGIAIEQAGPGTARFVMTVGPQHTNTFGVLSGGNIFAFADLAFGFACNARGEKAMTAGAAIEYLAPVPLGSRLVAEVTETAVQGRNAHYDVRLSVGAITVALVRGRMRILGGPVLEGL